MLSKFNPELPILHGEPEERLGVCAMGDVAKDDELLSMRVWVWQQDGANVAAASGNGGEHLGGHAPAATETPPFTNKWMVQTKLEPGSAQFVGGKAALAMAMAVVKHGDGSTEVQQWSQGIMVAKPHDHDPHG